MRYFDKSEGELFDRLLMGSMADVKRKFPNVKTEILYDDLQYENVAYTLHPQAQSLVENAAAKIGKTITFADERGGTTATPPANMPTCTRWRTAIASCWKSSRAWRR